MLKKYDPNEHGYLPEQITGKVVKKAPKYYPVVGKGFMLTDPDMKIDEEKLVPKE